MSATPLRDRRAAFLADPALASALARFVRTRVPLAEIDDIVQSTIADALASMNAPENDAELKPWVFGIARNKVADFFRRTRREVARDPQLTEESAAAESAPESAKDLLRWAERELPEGEGAANTLEWMLREGAGEKLETIAEEANVPAPRVRQRVARLRKHFRARWAAQLAAVAALVALLFAIWTMWQRRGNDIAIPEPLPAPSSSSAPLPDPPTSPELRAAELRRDALDRCDAKDWRPCVDGLDAAKALDPAGDTDDRVQRARKAAADALTPLPQDSKDAPRKKAPPSATATTPSTPMPTPVPTGDSTPPAPRPSKPSPKAGPGASDFTPAK